MKINDSGHTFCRLTPNCCDRNFRPYKPWFPSTVVPIYMDENREQRKKRAELCKVAGEKPSVQ